jgi:putative ABC transport system permease protein
VETDLMILTLAFRNLFHDRIRLAVTLVGILFSIVLVAVQLGLYLGASKMITDNIDHAKADLWIAAFGAKSLEDGGMLLTSRERHYVGLEGFGIKIAATDIG